MVKQKLTGDVGFLVETHPFFEDSLRLLVQGF